MNKNFWYYAVIVAVILGAHLLAHWLKFTPYTNALQFLGDIFIIIVIFHFLGDKIGPIKSEAK
jgi:uncharacterized membrane protein